MEGKWSKKEILGHLIDSAYNNHQRIIRAHAQKHLIFQGYDQDEWVKRNKYQEREANELIELWYHTNVHLAHAIQSIPKELMERLTDDHNLDLIGMNPVDTESFTSLKFLVWDYISHLEHHLSQIIEGYDRQLAEWGE